MFESAPKQLYMLPRDADPNSQRAPDGQAGPSVNSTSAAPPLASPPVVQDDKRRRTQAGRPEHPVHKYFVKGAYNSKQKRYEVACNYCLTKMSGKPDDNMVPHILDQCAKAKGVRAALMKELQEYNGNTSAEPAGFSATVQPGATAAPLRAGSKAHAMQKALFQQSTLAQAGFAGAISKDAAAQVDVKLARWAFTSGVPFNVFDSPHFADVFEALPGCYVPPGKQIVLWCGILTAAAPAAPAAVAVAAAAFAT